MSCVLSTYHWCTICDVGYWGERKGSSIYEFLNISRNSFSTSYTRKHSFLSWHVAISSIEIKCLSLISFYSTQHLLLQFQNHGLPELPVPPLNDCPSHTYLGHLVPVWWFYSPFNHGVESEETTVETLLFQLQNVSIRDHMENKECRKGASGEGITNIFWLQSKKNRINRLFWSINNMYLLPFKNGPRYWNINRRDYLEVCHFSTSSELCRNAFTLKTVYTFLLIFCFG